MRRSTAFPVLLLAIAAPASAQDRVARIAPTDPQRPEAEVFLSTLNALSRMSPNAQSDSALWEAGLQGMIESLHDPYATVFTPAQSKVWEEDTTGNYSGIGLTISLLDNSVTVTGVFRGTPAENAGLQVGDVIVGVNDNDASEWDTDMAADSIKGPVGTKVRVSIRRAGYDKPIPFEITRAQVHVPAVSAGVMEGDIGYVVLDQVRRNAAQEMDQAVRKLATARGLIIDLRHNPGGYLDESLLLADLFLQPGSTLASTSERVSGGTPDQVTTESYEDRYPARVPDLPLVILVDGYTASGAEIFAGALQDYDRALILGQRSFGKGLVQTVMKLPHGRALKFTTGEWRTPLGRSLHRRRDMEFRPLPEELDTFPRVATPGGRSLLNAGGIFPDVAIADDTLTIAERTLISTAGDHDVPLGVRLAEFSFKIAKELEDAHRPPALDESRFDAFVQGLVAEGIPRSVVDAPGVREYLSWRTRLTIAARMEEFGKEADIRTERDPVLTEAVQLLGSVSSQRELFAAADAARKGEVPTKLNGGH